jgi:chemotaxis protein CheX
MPDEIDEARVAEGIRKATQEVFSTMLGMDMAAQPAYRETSKTGPVDGLVALIGLAGKWIGNGSICCTAELACKISERMLMSECGSVNQEVLDAMGEIANMVIGNFKLAVEDYLGPMGMSMPMVIFGRNFTARSLDTADWIVIPFTCEAGVLDVKVCLSSPTQPHGHLHHTSTPHLVI